MTDFDGESLEVARIAKTIKYGIRNVLLKDATMFEVIHVMYYETLQFRY